MLDTISSKGYFGEVLDTKKLDDLYPPFYCIWSNGAKDKRANDVGLFCSRCRTTSKRPNHVCQATLEQSTNTLTKWQDISKQDSEEGGAFKVQDLDTFREWIEVIKSILTSMGDGEISISPYDTAWVALVENVHGNGGPQFPSSIQWIVDSQMADGSWGDELIFTAHDRILNTLGCVVALKKWNLHPERCERGLSFLRENFYKLEDENTEHMTIGFEVAFPSLVEIAQKLDLEIPDNSPALHSIYEQRKLKLTKIPMDIMHKVPTSLLFSLEGMEGLDWEKLIKLQCEEGSFLFSPASTAFAFMNTKDEKCLEYLKKLVHRFNGGVPNVYPVDLFERVWSVDRLERLGVSRYFQTEIKECINYLSRYWTADGIAWARNTNVCDIDDTSMGFRLLRLHGHDVSPDVFRHFEKGGEFFCIPGQSTTAVTGLFNLYRATQVLFPGETILQEAKDFAYKFLRKKQASNQLLDKWIITKDLPGEVGYALDIPWYASLPRIEARFYLQQYGGKDDIWIGKILYRMSNVNNDAYLEFAKLDFNNCQAVHQSEWDNIQKWYNDYSLGECGLNDTTLLRTYFVAAASIFEPERSTERRAWTKTAMLVKAIFSHFENNSREQRIAFVNDFISSSFIDTGHSSRKFNWSSSNTSNRLVHILLGTLKSVSVDALKNNGKDVHNVLHKSFEKWLLTCKEENDKPDQVIAEVFVSIILACGGHSLSEEHLSHPQYKHLVDLTNRLCYQLGGVHKPEVETSGASTDGTATLTIESDMQELVQTVVRNSDGINSEIKQIFLTVAKSFFYIVYCPLETMDHHISEVLFKRVV
ncbi:hypothetical protein IFM89_020428 [Coptis chinensis]|uniref:Terpene synthase N-terminal domain-containing protein n=1 Tax=Coptis chinensis TaxID=261450 RepID=A0A835HNP8_9MAGN|nr:hypothetical protein IFM89_020428 [Coptis chinensis]